MAARKKGIAYPVNTYEELIDGLIKRRRALGLSQLEVDERAGLPTGYTGKIEARLRNLGPLSWSLILPTLGIRLAVVVVDKAGRHGQRRGKTHDLEGLEP